MIAADSYDKIGKTVCQLQAGVFKSVGVFWMMFYFMTCAEWDQLVAAVGEDDAGTHWKRMESWCEDKDPDVSSSKMSRGYFSPSFLMAHPASSRDGRVGLRPKVKLSDADAKCAELKDGESTVIGTLYMDDTPVRVPQSPEFDGDIQDYAEGAKLELREAMGDPAYQVRAYRVGDVLIADRNLLKNISWDDIKGQIKAAQDAAKKLAEEEAAKAAAAQAPLRRVRTGKCKFCEGDKALIWRDERNNAFIDSKGEITVINDGHTLHIAAEFCPKCGREFGVE